MKRKEHTYGIRNKEKLISAPKMCKTIGQISNQFIRLRVYNSLPEYITNLTSQILFKIQVKDWINLPNAT